MTDVYTVGHSNHSEDAFPELLREHGIELVVDVRSSPYSRYVPQANRETLARTLDRAGIAYRWMGDRLGGKPQGEVADYDELRASASFQEGIDRLLALAQRKRTAIMCAEGGHRHCHRHKLITPELLAHDATVLHIQPDGSLLEEEDGPQQLRLF
jgi:uncharacterized protein (DUF488 family)